MGVHTGDSITVAPAQTLSDVEYQQMRDAAFACIRRVGVETGGSNIQFAVEPATGQQLVIEMNPRVSRSSALASKATGFPIAKIAARLAIGYTLDEIRNDITRATPACFEPTIDYVVTKVPRWAFEKLPGASGRLGTRMQSVGEVMAIGRTFAESLQKALRGLEQGRFGLNCDPGGGPRRPARRTELLDQASSPTPSRIFEVEAALRRGATVDEVADGDGDRPVVPRPDRRDRRRPPPPRRAVRLGARALADSAEPDWRRSSGSASRTRRSPGGSESAKPRCAGRGSPRASRRPSRRSTPAVPSSRPRRRTTTRPTRTSTRCVPRPSPGS